MGEIKIAVELLAPFRVSDKPDSYALEFESAPTLKEIISTVEKRRGRDFSQMILSGGKIKPGITILKDGINISGPIDKKISKSCNLVFCIAVSGG